MTIAFTVYFIPAGEEEFADGSIYKVQDNGVLTTTTPDGRRRIYSPNAWHHVELPPSQPKQASKPKAVRRAGSQPEEWVPPLAPAAPETGPVTGSRTGPP